MQFRTKVLAVSALFAAGFGHATSLAAQETLPWQSPNQYRQNAPAQYPARGPAPYSGQTAQAAPDPYRPGSAYPQSPAPRTYEQAPPPRTYEQPAPRYNAPRDYRQTQPRYEEPRRRYGANDTYSRERYPAPRRRRDERPSLPRERGTYSQNEVVDAGHRFFGSLSRGLAKAIEWTFRRAGRPNGYILGEDAGGAFIAGLRYGEGRLYTKHEGSRRVFWQGPSIGYDFGGEGSRTMVLVYNLRSPGDVYRRFAGVQGAAYLVGGVGVQLLKAGDMTVAPIRTGVGLRLGANIGYLKYTRRPTWNPF